MLYFNVLPKYRPYPIYVQNLNWFNLLKKWNLSENINLKRMILMPYIEKWNSFQSEFSI